MLHQDMLKKYSQNKMFILQELSIDILIMLTQIKILLQILQNMEDHFILKLLKIIK